MRSGGDQGESRSRVDFQPAPSLQFSMERDLLRARLSQLPQLPHIDAAPTPDDLDSESLDSFPSTSSPLPIPCVLLLPPSLTSLTNLPLRSHHHRSTDPQSYTPISASSYFSQALSVSLPSSSLVSRVYYTPPTSEGRGTVIVCVHGAGYSGLSWARFAKCVEEKGDASVGVLAYDVRGHG
jgi:protein phosphatase methylesterase 1